MYDAYSGQYKAAELLDRGREDLAERLINEGKLDRKSAYYAADQVLLWADRITSGEVRPPASEIDDRQPDRDWSERQKTIGFIGLGIMGSRMAANLLAAGNDLVVYNRHMEKADDLVEGGATVLGSPAEVGRQADLLITMLATPEAVEEVALGADGFLDQMSLGSVWVDSSTVNPSFVQRMAGEAARRGVHYLEAPVAGTKGPAEQGELTFFIGGQAETLELCRPYLDKMGKAVHHMGGHGAGASMKMLFNLLLGQSMLAFAEALALGQALGLEQARLLETLVGGPVVAPFVSV